MPARIPVTHLLKEVKAIPVIEIEWGSLGAVFCGRKCNNVTKMACKPTP
jgi:hypothetical protein